jgi:FkbM family methyltransferase
MEGKMRITFVGHARNFFASVLSATKLPVRSNGVHAMYQNIRKFLDLQQHSNGRSKYHLLTYAVTFLTFRIPGRRVRENFPITVAGVRFAARANSGDLGVIHEILCRRIYQREGFTPADGETCIDLGANIGCVSLQWAQVNSSGPIIAVEPHPDTYQRLKANLVLNGVSNVRPIHAAVGSHSGELSLMTSTDSNMARAHDSELIRWNRDAHGYELSRAIQVPMYSLDDVLRQHNISHVHL